jgi:hypothetical protein
LTESFGSSRDIFRVQAGKSHPRQNSTGFIGAQNGPIRFKDEFKVILRLK